MTDTSTITPDAPSAPVTPVAPVIADPKSPTRCAVTTKPDGKGRRCVYEIHQDSIKHVYVNRTKTKETLASVVPAGFTLTAEAVKAGEAFDKRGTAARVAKPRSNDQKRVDGEAAKNYPKNKQAGHNTETAFEKLVLSRFIVPPRAVDAVLDLLRTVTTLGGPEVCKGTVMRYRKGTHPSGNLQIQWAFVDKAPKKPVSA